MLSVFEATSVAETCCEFGSYFLSDDMKARDAPPAHSDMFGVYTTVEMLLDESGIYWCLGQVLGQICRCLPTHGLASCTSVL